MQRIEPTAKGGLRIGALVSNTAVADHPDVRRNYPLLSRAILSGASQQIRNAASVGGNMLQQRTRCPYYYDTAFACNKREPGSGCPAATGVNRMHALLGASDQCVAVHPSDMCVAIAALDASVEVEGRQGKPQIPFTNFHRLPGNTPQRDTRVCFKTSWHTGSSTTALSKFHDSATSKEHPPGRDEGAAMEPNQPPAASTKTSYRLSCQRPPHDHQWHLVGSQNGCPLARLAQSLWGMVNGVRTLLPLAQDGLVAASPRSPSDASGCGWQAQLGHSFRRWQRHPCPPTRGRGKGCVAKMVG